MTGGARTRFARLLFSLYPRRFRDRFGTEWWETAAWHWSATRDRRRPALAYALALAGDGLTALPRAHVVEVVDTLRGVTATRGEVRQVLRGLGRAPLFTLTAVMSVAMGIGANAAMFTAVNAVLLEPLPYPEADRLVIVWNELSSGQKRLPMAGVQVAELGAEPGLFERVGGIWASTATVTGADGTGRSLAAGTVTPDFFSVLGVLPAVGRNFDPDPGGGAPPPGVIISDELWRGEFGAVTSVVGRTIEVDGEFAEVIGVMPPGFTLFLPADGGIPARLDVYRPLPWDLTYLPPGQRFLRVVGRLLPGVDLGQASAAVATAGDRVRARYAELETAGDRLTAAPLHADAVRNARPVLMALMGGVLLFLLLASANVASLLLARASTRSGELAVRAAIGASRAQLARLLLLEGSVIALAGTAMGLAAGALGADVLWSLRPVGMTRVETLSLDPTVVLFTIAVSFGATLLFGLAPLVAVSGRGPALNLKATPSGRTGLRLREIVTVAEVALGLILVVGAGLLTQSLMRLDAAQVGFDKSDAMVVTIPMPRRQYPGDAQRAEMAREIERRVGGLAGVAAVGGTSHMPFAPWANWAGNAPPEQAPESEHDRYFFDHRSVTVGYMNALGATLAEGRLFTAADDGDGQPVVIIDRTAAEQTFPGASAVGRLLVPTRYVGGEFVETPAVVVGVIEDIRDVSPGRPSTGQVYWPFAQSARWELTWLVRGEGDRRALAAAVREEVRGVDAGLSVGTVTSTRSLARGATAQARFVAMLGGVFSALALGLAALGLYGIVTFITVRRLHEMGLRMVLGAPGSDVMKRILGRGLQLAGAGVGIGLVGALFLNRFLDALLYGVGVRDPLTLAGVCALFLVVAVVASVVPGRRAVRVDPASLMRE